MRHFSSLQYNDFVFIQSSLVKLKVNLHQHLMLLTNRNMIAIEEMFESLTRHILKSNFPQLPNYCNREDFLRCSLQSSYFSASSVVGLKMKMKKKLEILILDQLGQRNILNELKENPQSSRWNPGSISRDPRGIDTKCLGLRYRSRINGRANK